MKKNYLIFLLMLTQGWIANAQDFEWANGFGDNGFEAANAVVTDASGNVYTTGRFEGTVDFDPGPGVTNITSSFGSSDVFVQKLDSDGNLIWVKSFGGSDNDYGYSLVIDNIGNVYTTGSFYGAVDFDPGSGTSFQFASGFNDVFIQKMDAFGNFIWAKTFGGTSGDRGFSIAIDDFGDIYTTGRFAGTVDFDPGTGTTSLSSAGNGDIFVQKMDANGNLIWAKSLGGTNDDSGNSIAVDDFGDVYTTGRFEGTVDFDPGTGTTSLSSAGSNDIFVQKMDANGNFIWAKIFGGTSNDIANSIAIDASGNLYTTGFFKGTVDFDPGSGTTSFTSNGSGDVFILKLDSNGNFIWNKVFGGTDTSVNGDVGYSIALDDSGNVYSCGFFQGTVDFDPGSGTTNFTSNGSGDIFIQKLNPNGVYIWTQVFGSNSYDVANAMTVNPNGSIYTAGRFGQTVDFDPGAGITNLTSAGNYDIFIQKMSQCQPNTGTDVKTACDSYTWIDGNTYTSSNNTATHTLTNVDGCDSVVTLDLTINSSNTGTDVQTACDSYTWIDGNTYTSSNNTATHTLTNVDGCDSIVTLDLTINNSNTGTDVQTACDSYTWIDGNTYTSSNNTATHTLTNVDGCDSIITLDLTINNSNTGTDVQTACDSYTWIDGNTYTSSNNTATHTLTNVDGCDSVVTLDLTINNSNTGTDVQTACDSYTWIDGNTYTSSNNTATHILTNVNGCDSIVTLDLTINNSNTGTDLQTACDSYTWIDGNTYTSSNNTATYTLTNVDGCDSIVTLNLTISNSNTGTDVQTSCDSYTWIDGNTYTADNNTATYTLTNVDGCDSIVTLDLTINNSNTGTDVQTACDSYTWIDGNTYTSSNNTATHTLTNVTGCDSVVTLDLTINEVTDITTTTNGVTISANNQNATYQWLDCDANYAQISNETSADFTASQNGEYAVELSENGCMDTSDCIVISTVGIENSDLDNQLSIYPNPNNGTFTLESKFLGATYTIVDAQGRVVTSGKIENQRETISLEKEVIGVYYLKVENRTLKIVKR